MTQVTKVFFLERTQRQLSGTNIIGKDGKVVALITGSHSFSTTDTDVEVSVKDENAITMGIVTADIWSIALTNKDGSPVDDDQLSTDGAVSSDAVTVFRNVGTTANQAFYYTIIAQVARKYAAGMK